MISPHATFAVEVEGAIDVHYASLASSLRSTARGNYPDGHPSRYHYPRPTRLNFGERTGTSVFTLAI